MTFAGVDILDQPALKFPHASILRVSAGSQGGCERPVLGAEWAEPGNCMRRRMHPGVSGKINLAKFVEI